MPPGSRSFSLRHIALGHLKRRKARTVILAIGLLVGTVAFTSVSAINEGMRADIGRKMDEFGANMVVTPDSADLLLSYGGTVVSGVTSQVVELTEEDAAAIRTIRYKENINLVAPKLLGLAEVDGRRAMIMGVRFRDEVGMRQWWDWRGTIPDNAGHVLLGSEASHQLRKDVGDSLMVSGRQLEVASVLEPTGTQDDSLVYTELGLAQDILGKPGKLSLVEVSAWCAQCPVETLVIQIAEKLPNARVNAVKQAVASKLATLDVVSRFALILSLAVLLVGGLMVMITMLASINERIREIGVFRAIGFRRGHIMQIVLIEAFAISLASGIVGFLFGTLVAGLLAGRIAEASVPVPWDPFLAMEAVGLAVVMGMAGGFYPAWRASRLDPVTALRAL
ncbi:MAG: ABC transporter permease [Dehalococcoidia bacterium]|nr:ABC transporter permease [Dehalococcoidia bacterium]